jgi:preprotein translocase subunit YajC
VDQALSSLIFLGLLIAIFYFMLIRPQKRRVQAHQNLIGSLEIGDDIITIGGLHGTVRALRGDDIEIEVAKGTTLRFVKSAIARKVNDEVVLEPEDAAGVAEE